MIYNNKMEGKSKNELENELNILLRKRNEIDINLKSLIEEEKMNDR